MSNNQWNSGPADGQSQPPGEWGPAPQPSAGEWAQEAAAAPGQEWGQGKSQQSASDWTTGAQPQSSASDWNAAPQQQGWDQSQQQGWGQGQQQGWGHGPQQGWDQSQQQGWGVGQPGGMAPGQPWQSQPRTTNAFRNVFDFSFKKSAVPEAVGTIFLITTIAIGLWWLGDVINAIVIYSDFGLGGWDITQMILGGLIRAVVLILLVRVFLEGMSALVTQSKQQEKSEES